MPSRQNRRSSILDFLQGRVEKLWVEDRSFTLEPFLGDWAVRLGSRGFGVHGSFGQRVGVAGSQAIGTPIDGGDAQLFAQHARSGSDTFYGLYFSTPCSISPLLPAAILNSDQFS